jgi:release factor glutamine methyltransferase
LNKKDWTVLEMLNFTTDFFKNKNINEYRFDAEVLLAFVLKLKRLDLYLNFDRLLKEDEISFFKKLIQKRVKGIPVAYILGNKEFMGLKFDVNPNVLIPRPETEILVEEVLSLIEKNMLSMNDLTVVDVFSGSGNIPISIFKFVEKFKKNLKVYGIDISNEAIEVAKKNAIKHNVKDKIEFFLGDVLDPLKFLQVNGSIDIITANPPYIKTKDLESLDKEVRSEPLISLDGGNDGLFYYRKLILQSLDYLKKDGYIFMEISPELKEDLVKLLNENGFSDIKVKEDYQCLDRIMIARLGK